MSIYNDGQTINVQVDAHIIEDGKFHTVRYDVRVYDLSGQSEQNIHGFHLFHAPAYELLKMAGVPWRDAERTLKWAYTEALQAPVNNTYDLT